MNKDIDSPPNLVSEPRVEQTPPKLHLLVPETLPTAIQENGRRQRQTHRVEQDLRQGHEQHHRQMGAHKTGLLQIGSQPQSVANRSQASAPMLCFTSVG